MKQSRCVQGTNNPTTRDCTNNEAVYAIEGGVLIILVTQVSYIIGPISWLELGIIPLPLLNYRSAGRARERARVNFSLSARALRGGDPRPPPVPP